MVVSNYTYLQLKMSSPNGVITISVNFQQAYYYDWDYIALVTVISSSLDPTRSSRGVEAACVSHVVLCD